MFNFFKNHSAINKASDSLFMILNENARNKEFFASNGVQDNTDGRFELVAFFSTAIFLGLANRGEFAEKVSQKLFDKIFKTFDDALRNLGVSDTKVGPKIKKMAEHFYGRMSAYRKALDEGSGEDLRQILWQNLDRREDIDPLILSKLADSFDELRIKVSKMEI